MHILSWGPSRKAGKPGYRRRLMHYVGGNRRAHGEPMSWTIGMPYRRVRVPDRARSGVVPQWLDVVALFHSQMQSTYVSTQMRRDVGHVFFWLESGALCGPGELRLWRVFLAVRCPGHCRQLGVTYARPNAIRGPRGSSRFLGRFPWLHAPRYSANLRK